MLLLVSCLGSEKRMEVCYMDGFADFDRPIDLAKYKEYVRNLTYTDTIVISEQEYKQMRVIVNNLKNLHCNGCSVLWIKSDTLDICIQTIYNNVSDSIEHCLYQLKAQIGYYDGFDGNDLKLFSEIRKYGIPKRKLPKRNGEASSEVGIHPPKNLEKKVLLIVR